MLLACAHSTPPSSQPARVPKLAPDLAAPCDTLTGPSAPDYDVWQAWVVGTVLPAYAVCAARHNATVKAWPK